MKNLDVAIYLRKSRADVEREHQARENGETYDTLGKHRLELLEVAKKNEYNVIDVFEEVVSGEYISNRLAMLEMIDNIENNKYDAVLVVAIDRLVRGNKTEQGRIEDALRDSGTLIITPSEILDLTTETGEFSAEIQTFFANMEYRTIKRRMQRGLQNAARSGRDVGSNPPYGYKKGPDMHLVIDEEKAAVVRDIYKWSLEGMGVLQIVRRLHDLGIPSPTGLANWSKTPILRLLSNKKYAGYMTFGIRQKVKSKTGKDVRKVKRDPSKYIEVPDAHEPIIPKEMFDLVQSALKRRDPKLNEKKKLIYPLAGLLVCSRCNWTIRCQAPKDRTGFYLYCGNPACDQSGIRLAPIERAIINELSAILTRVKVNHADINESSIESEREELTRQIERIKNEIKKENAKKARIYESYEDGTYSKEMFVERLNVVHNRIREHETRIPDLERERDALEEKSQTKTELIPAISSVLDLYQMTDKAEHKNQLLKTIVDRIVYDRTRTDFRRSKDPEDFSLTIYLIE